MKTMWLALYIPGNILYTVIIIIYSLSLILTLIYKNLEYTHKDLSKEK